MTRYVVLVGCNYPVDGAEVRREAGDVVDDLPPSVEAALLEMRAVLAEDEYEALGHPTLVDVEPNAVDAGPHVGLQIKSPSRKRAAKE